MRNSAHREKKALQVVISFEPNRLSDEGLATAYELVIPLIRQDTARRSKERPNSGELLDSKNERMVLNG